MLVATVAVTLMVAVLAELPVLAVKLQVIVPVSVPLVPNVIVSQLPDVTDALHVMIPVPVLDTLNVVVPASFATSRLAGLTESTGVLGVTLLDATDGRLVPAALVAVTVKV